MDTVEITRSLERYQPHDDPAHLWSITQDGERIAELWVDPEDQQIAQVWVHEDHRSHGLAASLYRQASSEMTVYHAPPWHRTDDGDRWAEMIGGPTIDTCTCCDHLTTDEDH